MASVMQKIVREVLRPFRRRRRSPSHALNELDLKIEPYLDFDNGFFIEAGANDGKMYSNTLYFEERRNWTGILVEPVQELAQQCITNRPNCVVECCALVSSDYESVDVEMTYCNMMSVVKGALKTTEAEANHIAAGCEIQNVESYQLKSSARTLTSILDEHAVDHIDLLSLDVEGYEINALNGIDFDRHAPRFMLIEARFRREIDACVCPRYKPVASFGNYDVLYELT